MSKSYDNLIELNGSEILRLDTIIGSLMISQFKNQQEYRAAISEIIKSFFDGLK
tara:strand:+ start:2027 stop:2188 length:162 start_codon:yes stop_codon:yes gene_type:complete